MTIRKGESAPVKYTPIISYVCNRLVSLPRIFQPTNQTTVAPSPLLVAVHTQLQKKQRAYIESTAQEVKAPQKNSIHSRVIFDLTK